MGNNTTCSFGEDFEDPTASTWVGYVGWLGVGRIEMESEGGSWDFDIEVGIDNAAIPASILYRQKCISESQNGLMTGNILMCFCSKASADVLWWYVGKFWSYRHDGFVRHLKKWWTS